MQEEIKKELEERRQRQQNKRLKNRKETVFWNKQRSQIIKEEKEIGRLERKEMKNKQNKDEERKDDGTELRIDFDDLVGIKNPKPQKQSNKINKTI